MKVGSIPTLKPAKITLVISSLGAGGAERVLVNMANYWARRGEDITIVSLDSPDAPVFHSLDERIDLKTLNLLGNSGNAAVALLRIGGRVRTIRKALREIGPDVIISFMDRTNVLTLMASRGLKVPVIVSDRVDPAFSAIGRPWRILRRLSYGSATALVLQSGRFKPYYRPEIQAKVAVIPNPISGLVRSRQPLPHQDRQDLVLAMGRLTYQKSFHLVIDAFADLAAAHPTWKLHIYGHGPDQAALQSQIDEKNLNGRITLMGVTEEALERMSEASVFALSSVSEGIPNVLIEAMAMGCAAVSTDVGGVPDIMVDGQDGLIIPMGDQAGLTRALGRLMSDPSLRHTLGENAISVRERLSEDRIMGMWGDLVASTLNRSGEVRQEALR